MSNMADTSTCSSWTGATYTLPTTPTWTTTTTPWSVSTDPQMVKAWMGAVIERLEHLQQRIRELEAKNGR